MQAVTVRLLLSAGCLAGCSYGWTAGGTADAGSGSDAPLPVEAATEAGADDANIEAGLDAPAPQDATTDDAAGPSCGNLEADALSTRAAAITCLSGPSACTTTITDECGCQVVVGASNSTQTASFQAAVNAFVQAHCPRPGRCPTCSTPQKGLCVLTDAGSGQTACYQ